MAVLAVLSLVSQTFSASNDCMTDTEFPALETRRIKLLDGLLRYRQINLPKDNTPPRLPGDAVGRETPVSANLAVKTLQTPQYSGAVFSSSHKHHNAFSKPPPYRLYFFSPHALNNSTTPTGSNLGHTHRYSTTTLFIRDGITVLLSNNRCHLGSEM